MGRIAFIPTADFLADITPWRPANAGIMAKKYNVSPSTIRNTAKKLRIPGYRHQSGLSRRSRYGSVSLPGVLDRVGVRHEHEEASGDFPDSPILLPREPLIVEGDVIVLFDLHVPHHDAALLKKACRFAKERGIGQLLFGGDIFSHGAWNPRDTTFERRRYQDDLTLAREIFGLMIDEYDFDLFAIMGNHDSWFYDYMKGEIDPEFLMPRLTREISVTANQWCEVVSGGLRFRVEHGSDYSGSNPLGVAQKLAAKYLMPVIVGHQHLAASGFDASATMQCIASGAVFDPRLIPYQNRRHRTNPAMTQGFVIIQDGWATHYSARDPALRDL